MKHRTRPNAPCMYLIVLSILLMVTGCQKFGAGVAAEPQPAPPAQEVKTGPPTHAPAHGYRAKHHYRYYPEAEVYYDTGRSLYFYLSNGQWTAGVSLPGSIRLDTSYVSLELDTSRPYEYHDQQKSKHPGKGKKNKKI